MQKQLCVTYALLMVLSAACQLERGRHNGASGTKPAPSRAFYPVRLQELTVTTREVVYVPVYSHIALPGAEERTLYLSATLSIRNTDLQQRILITSVAYYDTNGALVEEYVPDSRALAPMASTEIVVPQLDTRGGSGANFLVHWAAETAVSAPLIEAIMAGTMGNYSFAFARPGRTVPQLPVQPAEPAAPQ